MHRSSQAPRRAWWRPLASILMALALSLSFSACDPREWFVCAIGACGPEYDEVPPERPRQLAATPGDSRITLTWTHNVPPDLRHYSVHRGTTPGGPYPIVNTADGSGFVDTGLTNGVTYYYVVTARDTAANESSASTEVLATPQPAAPGPRLAAPVLEASDGGGGGINLQWTEVAGAKSYRIYKSTTFGGPYDLIDDTIVRFHVDRDVVAGTQYHYYVAAVDPGGQEGTPSSVVSMSPVHNPGPELTFRTAWGEPGETAGRFTAPRDIATDPAGNVYVTDNPTEIARVQKFSPTGAFLRAWNVDSSVHGVATDTSGNVYVVVASNHQVRKYTSEGVFVTQWGTQGATQGNFQSPTGIAVDTAGNVYVADSGNARIQKFSSAGVFVRLWAVTNGAVGVATDGEGNVYVVDKQFHRVQRFTSDGTPALDWGQEGSGPGRFSAPEGIHVDVAGRVFVADTGNDRLEAFDTAGVRAFGFGTTGNATNQFEGPTDIASDCAANVYVLDAGNARVKKYGPSSPSTCPTLATGGPVPVAAAAVRPGFSATMTTTASTAGKVTNRGGNVYERGALASGRFSGRLVGRASRSTRAFKAFAGGTWRARFDIAIDPRTRTGTAKGIALATPKRRSAGQLCLSFDLKVAGTKLTGTFKTVGGSGAARTLSAGGTFDQKLGKTAAYTLRGSGAPGRSAGRGLSAACRRLTK